MAAISTEGSTVLCARCGYDLRGSAIGEGCPECGLPVNATLSGYRVQGNFLIVRDDIVLPSRCVITNEPVDDRPIKKTLYWYHPALMLLILVNILIFALVAILMRKQCKVTYYMSREQAGKRRNKLLLASLALFGGFVIGIAGIVYESWPIGLGGLVVLLASLICLVVFASTLKITKVKQNEFWIKGAGPEFLTALEAGFA